MVEHTAGVPSRGIRERSVVRTTGIPAVMVVRPDDNDGLTRLREAGAWVIFDPQSIGACFEEIN